MPKLAAQAHAERLDGAIQSVFELSGLNGFESVDGVAFTRGPGLPSCLEVALKKTRELAAVHDLQTMAINHMEGHLLVPRMEDPSLEFPYLCLLVSGGHSQIVAAAGVGQYHLLGETLDIALGDAYDKVARALGISDLNGGRYLEEKAQHGNPGALDLVVPMKKYKNCDFSFSGLQTAIDVEIERRYLLSTHQSEQSAGRIRPASSYAGPIMTFPENEVCDIAASFQHTCFVHIIDRLKNALKWCEKTEFKPTALVISGGVASNTSLFNFLQEQFTPLNLRVVRPSPALCRDNAVMIGWAAQENLKAGFLPLTPEELATTRYIRRWPLDQSKTDYFPDSHPAHTSTPIEKYRKEVLEKSIEDLNSTYSPQTVLKVCRAYITNRNYEQAYIILSEARQTFQNDPHLEKLFLKLEPQYISWKNKYT